MTRLLVFALAALAVAGCGGDSSATTLTASSLSKAEFVKKANAICKAGAGRLLNEVTAYQKKHIDVASVKLIPDTGRTVIRPALQGQIDQIRSLGAPRGDAAKLERFFTILDRGVKEIIGQKKATTFEVAERMLEPANKIASRYGIDQCYYTLVKHG